MRAKTCIAVAATAISLWVVSGVPAAADDPVPLDLEQAKQVMALMDSDHRLSAIFAMCPADAFQRDAPFYALWRNPRSLRPAVCGKTPLTCYRHCVDDARSGSCFGLARAFQLNEKTVGSRYTQTLFAMACDAGLGSGCTNRASSLRNDPVENEPLGKSTLPAQQACEYRSFSLGCMQGDAWSCTMLGQSHEKGEGVGQDGAEARRYFKKSCDIAPDFAACTYAKSLMDDMKDPAQ